MEGRKTKEIMNKLILTVLVALVANISNAQKMIVYSLSGKIEDVSESTARPVRLRDAISPNTKLNIPYQGCVVLFDESSSQQFTLKTPGRATAEEMIADKKNSVMKLTGDYLAFIKKQITGGGQILVRNCSDPATVTRNLQVTSNYAEKDSELMICGMDGYVNARDAFMKDFKNFRKNMLDDYQAFRKKMLDDYADFVRDPWKTVKLMPPEEKPKDEKIKPVIIAQKDGKLISADFDKHKTAEIEKIDLSGIGEEDEEEEIVPLSIDDKGKTIVPDFNKRGQTNRD